jgi:quinol monooxygenase YgiN
MDQTKLHWVAEFSINEGKLETFKEIAQEIIAAIEQTEPNALMYEWHVSEDGTRCYVDEWYADTEAALAHLNGEAPKLLPKILEVSEFTGLRVYSTVASEELRGLLASFGAIFTENFGGFTR